eukprot:1177569-Prorocentrum_minimum.AAC.5
MAQKAAPATNTCPTNTADWDNGRGVYKVHCAASASVQKRMPSAVTICKCRPVTAASKATT